MTATPDWNALGDAQFKARVAAFVDAHCPAALRHLNRRPRWSEVGGWYATLARHGWLAPGWPTAHGGMGLHAARHLLYIEEMERCGAPWMPDSGVRNLGPVLIAHGSDAQKMHWLPLILSGTQVWCQGYSEPGAGSDLAGLRTSAHVQGDELVITGHKIWTTSAYDATHMFALVRTQAGSVRQAGISFVLLAMDQPGVTVRDIRNIAGEIEFCEVFLDNARTPVANIVGPMNDGWRIAKSLLGFERVWAGSPRKALAALWRTEALARQGENGLAQDPAFIDRLTQMRLDVQDLQSLYQRFAQKLRQGELGPEVSALKVWATETSQRASELLVEAAAGAGMLQGNGALAAFYDTRAPAIFSGTNQIQRNLIARNVLNLPGKS
ncbi:MAG: acyl-CoA dehydrogenase family protein [Burkholderiaceae bacterium]|nr:acyl-CoA dehydrogenase family protein [Burkholderiaceae bacterium]